MGMDSSVIILIFANRKTDLQNMKVKSLQNRIGE